MNRNFTSLKSNTAHKTTLFYLFVFMFASLGMFAQEVPSAASSTLITDPAVEVAFDSNIDFVNWFMSSKQNTQKNEVKGEPFTSTKKQIITSGSHPNKVLYRTFVKKITSKDTAIV